MKENAYNTFIFPLYPVGSLEIIRVFSLETSNVTIKAILQYDYSLCKTELNQSNFVYFNVKHLLIGFYKYTTYARLVFFSLITIC